MKRNPYLDSDECDEGVNWNPSSHCEQEDLCLANYSMQNSEMESQHKRPSHKNKYINKITLIKPEETTSTKKRHLTPSNFGIHPEQLKKLKNREAAKESRQRKKLYINLIEEQTKKLQKQIELTNRQIETCKIEIQKSAFNNSQSIGSFDSKIIHVHKKIERLLAAEDSEEKNNELNLAIDSIIYRFGATGKQRKNNINESYRQIMAITPSIIHRYFMWAAKEKAHIFSADSEGVYQQWFEEMRRNIVPDIADHSEFLEDKRADILDVQEVYSKSASQLKQTKDRIQIFLNILDNQFLQIRDIFTPTQSAKFILFIEKYKYRQQLRFIENQIFFDEQYSRPPKKHLKVEGQ